MLRIEALATPLNLDADGVARVGGTRITLDTIVATFEEGATPEEIVSRYAPLDVADVYAVITFYLRHRPEVEEYLRRRAAEAAAAREFNEGRSSQRDLRERLLRRRNEEQQSDAPSGG